MKTRILSAFVLIAFVSNLVQAQDIVDEWRYTLKAPIDGWQAVDFDESSWTEGFGGFGTRNTPGSRVATEWNSNDIWLRKSFDLKSVPQKPALFIHHDEDAQIFINGKELVKFERWTTEYTVVPIEAGAASVLKAGINVMAVHCHQKTGGQFIDVHVVDADNVPKLPRPKRSLVPYQSPLLTTWGDDVTAENVWTEYPRPLMFRENWTNLNGNWDYAITSATEQVVPGEWAGEILVPFCLESKLGGVQRLLEVDESLWYHRKFEANPTAGSRTLLNFEAVDYRCSVFVNGHAVGEHTGGNNPFSLDITSAVRRGENKLIVRVEDETEAWQLRGKQVLNPGGIFYTQVSGIWQTVWLEEVPLQFIEDLNIATDAAKGTITVQARLGGTGDAAKIMILVSDNGGVVAEAMGDATSVSVVVPNPNPWSPDSPFLYDLEIRLLDANDKQIDQVRSYAGIRTVGKA
ncbi:MAG: glycoside hydrolase family 2, partial [Planctomycetota bacterium]|nr:glycoside hydrolase family 2 [Planctomycetota bacterium]